MQVVLAERLARKALIEASHFPLDSRVGACSSLSQTEAHAKPRLSVWVSFPASGEEKTLSQECNPGRTM